MKLLRQAGRARKERRKVDSGLSIHGFRVQCHRWRLRQREETAKKVKYAAWYGKTMKNLETERRCSMERVRK